MIASHEKRALVNLKVPTEGSTQRNQFFLLWMRPLLPSRQ